MGQVATFAVTGLDGVAFGLLLFVAAAGLALIFGVMDVLNMAHGTLYLLGAYLAYLFTDGSLLGLLAAVAVGVAAGTLGGAALAAVLRPLAARGHLDQGLATLGIAFLAGDAFTTVFGATPLPADPPMVLAGRIDIAGFGYPTYRLMFIAVAAAVAVALHWIVRHTTAGVMLRATVTDPAMAAATGINTARVRIAALAVGATLAVTAGVLGAPLLGPAPGVDTTVLVLSLIVVVLGGAGSIPATLAAALLVGQVQTLGVLAAPALAPFALFGALFVVLVIRGQSGAPTAVRPA
ncbi:branched-chain amino acid ABC transporter permease [Micromonospora peucetia]|uniref:Amino acid/amide ABC transporter membrane protein 1, HAAT family n=1 Tax=Micromonospora peucetia TaxID=47871 RepID=A0A1C6W4Y4_9ACTN|nr:branched-chain amino acid ABC transporter permease [Micromonospora peucetia]SCL73588.1 amino acid/amide ABC transporter membrane protein 1, HAAT family [Micromonospora peucetia]